jgi:rhodanese-related sulfurtransferase
MKTILAAVFLIASFVPCVARASEGFGELTPQEVAAKLKQKNVYVFDNNAKERWEKSHVPGAKWLHPSEYEAKDLPADKSATLIFYCANPH